MMFSLHSKNKQNKNRTQVNIQLFKETPLRLRLPNTIYVHRRQFPFNVCDIIGNLRVG